MEEIYSRRRHLGGVRKLKKKKKILNLEAEVFKRNQLPGKYTVKILFEWNNRKFEDEYLKKLKRSWAR